MAVILAGVTLPDDIVWLDELDAPQVAQATQRTVDGAFVVEETALQQGTPITLGGGVWVQRSSVIALRNAAATAGDTHQLDLRGQIFTVVFARPRPIEAVPVIRYAEPDPADPHEITIRLFTAAP